MTAVPFITRVVLQNYRSIRHCDVPLGPLTYLVGPNGSGKSNFLDSLHLLSDALTSSLELALNVRGGFAEVRRRSRSSGGHPTDIGIRIEFKLDGRSGFYAVKVASLTGGGFEVREEKCALGPKGSAPYFKVAKGKVVESSESTTPALVSDRLALVSLSGLAAFRPLFDALTSMGFYNLNPKVMRELQRPQEGRLLKPVGENIASVIGHLDRTAPEALTVIREYLQTVVPTIQDVGRASAGPMETLQFKQKVADAKHELTFYAQNMSDGTLRALGVLTALFQGNRYFAPSLIGIEEPETALHPAASAALREALARAATSAQVIVTSHSPDLLDDDSVLPEQLLAVVADAEGTKIAPLDQASRETIRNYLFSAGELLRLGQLSPDPELVRKQNSTQSDLFDEAVN
jgi:predicted ATPase